MNGPEAAARQFKPPNGDTVSRKTSQATGCTPMQHALTQIPYAVIAAGISVIGYLAIAW